MSAVTFRAVKSPNPATKQLFRRSGYNDVQREFLKREGQACHYSGTEKNITFDHIVPRSRGGSDGADNMVPACFSCNSSRGNKDFDEFIEWREYERAAYVSMMIHGDCL